MFGMTWHAAIGWVGVASIVLAYLLSSHKRIKDVPHQLMNMGGALLYGVDLFMRSTWEGVTLEIIWFLIGVSALVRIARIQRTP